MNSYTTKSFADFKKRQDIRRVADNTKSAVLAILIVSVLVFAIAGDDAVKPYIWFWAAFMAALVLVCAIQDLINTIKIKRLGL